MSEITDRIAAIIEEHYDCDEACRAYDFGEVAQHIAQEIDKVFRFFEETRVNVMSSCGMTTDYRTGVTTTNSDMRYDHRYVTKWEER